MILLNNRFNTSRDESETVIPLNMIDISDELGLTESNSLMPAANGYPKSDMEIKKLKSELIQQKAILK